MGGSGQTQKEGEVAATSPIARTLVAVATYNEMENLPRLLDAIHRCLPDADLLVVDDNSPDGTGQWCQERAARDPRMHCLRRKGKLGLGTALLAAMRYALDHGYPYLVTMDADFSHPPETLPALVAGMEDSSAGPIDVMIGSRYIAGGRIQGWPLVRHLMSRTVNCYCRRLLRLSPRDCSSGMRCYRTAILARLDFREVRSHGYAFEEEILWRLKRAGARFGEIAIRFVNRKEGASKVYVGEIAAAMGTLFRLTCTEWLKRRD
jgi:dolichol-phosphate mannosyltransferase